MNFQELMLEQLDGVVSISEEFLKSTSFFQEASQYTSETFEKLAEKLFSLHSSPTEAFGILINAYLNIKRKTAVDNCNDLFDIPLAYLIFNSKVIKEKLLPEMSYFQMVERIVIKRPDICTYDNLEFHLFKTSRNINSDFFRNDLEILTMNFGRELHRDIVSQSSILYLINAAGLKLFNEMTTEQKNAILLNATTDSVDFYELRYESSFVRFNHVNTNIFYRFKEAIEAAEDDLFEFIDLSFGRHGAKEAGLRVKMLLFKMYISEHTRGLSRRTIRHLSQIDGESTFIEFGAGDFRNHFNDEVGDALCILTRKFLVGEKLYPENQYSVPTRQELLRTKDLISSNTALRKGLEEIFTKEHLDSMMNLIDENDGLINRREAIEFADTNFSIASASPGASTLMIYILYVPGGGSASFKDGILSGAYKTLREKIAKDMLENLQVSLEINEKKRQLKGKRNILSTMYSESPNNFISNITEEVFEEFIGSNLS